MTIMIQTVSITIRYDNEVSSEPKDWNWRDLLYVSEEEFETILDVQHTPPRTLTASEWADYVDFQNRRSK